MNEQLSTPEHVEEIATILAQAILQIRCRTFSSSPLDVALDMSVTGAIGLRRESVVSQDEPTRRLVLCRAAVGNLRFRISS